MVHSARDNVTVQTSYKSPASVHIFSFSSDDRALFPEIPNSTMGTIRTQVDLRGWSVESLSPTTVHITLLEQSDPKGWTSKSSLPTAMVSAVAGVGEYAIKHGAPPVVTRLLGAKAKFSKYEHETSSYRFDYEFVCPEEVSNINELPNIECELRCDVETWSANLDLVIDPPPINVSCLRRHKLSLGGGGLWLTVEHAAASLEDDPARITVRKSNAGKEKGVVLVNGVSIKVDVDELEEDKMQELFKKKRTRPQRVPLDLTSPAYAAKQQASHRASPALSSIGEFRAATPGLSVASSDRAPSPAPSIDRAPDPPPDHNKDAMASALDVLFLLRRIYAERSPDPAVSPAGWATVSERNGTHVRRKLLQSLSPTVMVQRVDKVVQGLAAEDILTAISSLRTRKFCDEKVDAITRLESFGHGCGSYFTTTKASFPFRGRAFYVAHLTAKTTSASDGDEGTPSPLDKPPAYFYAAASFPESLSCFPAEKLNPTALPVGKVLVDGWILETLDPYAPSSYQIPSTRLTHVIGIDYAGALPAAVNSSWNAALPRSISAFEQALKVKGLAPALTRPPRSMIVTGDGRDERADVAWEASAEAVESVVLDLDWDPATSTSTTLILRTPNGQALKSREQTLSDASTERGALRETNGLIRPQPSLAGSLKDAGELPRDRTESTISRATSIGSLSNAVEEAKKAAKTKGRRSQNDVLLEAELDLKAYPHGYRIDASCLLPSSPPSDSKDARAGVLTDLRSGRTMGQTVPVRVAVYELPPSALSGAALDAGPRRNKQLVRISLDRDTLGEEIVSRIGTDNHILRCAIVPLKVPRTPTLPTDESEDTSRASTPPPATVVANGENVDVMHVNQTSAMLQREERTPGRSVILKK